MAFLHLGISVTPVILGTLFYFNNNDSKVDVSNTGDIFMAIVPIIALASIFFGNRIFRKTIQSIPKNASLKDKLNKFQTASIIKYALLEGGSLFSIVIFANTQNLVYLIIGAFLIFFLFLQHPTKQTIENALELRGKDKTKFNRANTPLE